MPLWCESILGFKVEAVQGKQVSLEWTETSGGLWEWCHDPGVPLAFPVESVSSCDATGTPGILSRTRRERIPPLELGGGNGAPLVVGGTPGSFILRVCVCIRCTALSLLPEFFLRPTTLILGPAIFE